MAIDLFGHDGTSLYIPFPSGKYSHGPDAYIRNAECWDAGTNQPCPSGNWPEGQIRLSSDHSCCCDPCRHKHTNICERGGCKCVPKFLCINFIAYSGQEDVPACGDKTWTIELQNTFDRAEANDREGYSKIINGIGRIDYTVGEPEISSVWYGSGYQTWRLDVSGVTQEEVPITNHRGAVNCLAPPEFELTNVTIENVHPTGLIYYCSGDIYFSQYSLTKIPFEKRYYGGEEFSSVECGSGTNSCSQVCNVLCVKRNSTYGVGDYTQEEFIFDSGTSSWISIEDDESFDLVDLSGQCYIHLNNLDVSSLDNDYIEIDPDACSLGMVLTALAEDGDWIKISCNPCSCWDHVCGTCRCICGDLCLVTIENSGIGSSTITREDLTWDKDNFEWTNGSTTIELSAASGIARNCQVSSEDYDTAAQINDNCGSQVSFILQDSIATQLVGSHAKFTAGWCKTCEEDCTRADCFGICEDVPSTLVVTLTGSYFQVEGEYEVEYDCFGSIEFTIAMIYSTEASGEWRWIGVAYIDCGDGNTYHLSLDLGCDGSLNIAITDESGNNVCSVTGEMGSLPCNELWDVEFSTQLAQCELSCCTGSPGAILTFAFTE